MNDIYDLIYCLQSEVQELLSLYPDAKIEDASDMVHEERFSFRVEDTEKNYLKNLITSGASDISLVFQIAIHEKTALIKEILTELKAAKKGVKG